MATRTETLTNKQRAFLEQPFYGAVTTLRRDGSPHTTVVWVDVDEEGATFNTAVGRAKERHLRRDPRLSLIVIDSNDPYKWIAVSGHAELRTEGADEQIDKLAKKYLGKDEYPYRTQDEQRVSVRIRADHVETYGLD